MNEHFYMPLPVAMLVINQPRKNRHARRIVSREMARREIKWTAGAKQQLPKRRKYHKGGHNKDRYHK